MSDFVKNLPPEISGRIFQCVPQKSLLKAARVSKAWYMYAEYELFQEPPLPNIALTPQRLIQFLVAWKKMVKKLERGNQIRRFVLIPTAETATKSLLILFQSGLQVEKPILSFVNVAQIETIAASHRAELVSFVRNTKHLEIFPFFPSPLDGLDLIMGNVKALTVNFPADELGFFRGPVTEAPLLEELIIKREEPVEQEPPTVSQFLRHYQMPKLRKFQAELPLGAKTLRHVFTASLEDVIVNGHTLSLRSIINIASQAGARLKSLRVGEESCCGSPANADLPKTDFSCVSSLEHFHLHMSELSAKGLKTFIEATKGNLITLKTMAMQECLFTDSGLAIQLLELCPKLRDLSVSMCGGFNDYALIALRNCIEVMISEGRQVNLKTLDISACEVQPAIIETFFDDLPINLDTMVVSPHVLPRDEYESVFEEDGHVRRVIWLNNDYDDYDEFDDY